MLLRHVRSMSIKRCLDDKLHRQFSTDDINYNKAIEFLNSFRNYERIQIPDQTAQDNKFSLVNMRRLLWTLGDPQSQMQVVHVTGSKGKGSFCHMLGSIFAGSALRIGTYTSPHVLDITERICIGGDDNSGNLVNIPKNEFSNLILNYKDAIENIRADLTYFEIVTALALKYFQTKNIKHAIIEVGICGESDATNVFEDNNLSLAVIMPVGYEHANLFGNSLENIIIAKTAILKDNCHLLICRQSDNSITKSIVELAKLKNCVIHEFKDLVKLESQGFEVTETEMYEKFKIKIHPRLTGFANGTLLRDVSTRLIGQHQQDNIKAAIEAAFELKKQGWDVRDKGIRRALQNLYLPGRLNIFRKNKKENWYIVDGAHTEDSAKALFDIIIKLFPKFSYIYVIGMLKDKEHDCIFRIMMSLKPKCVIFTNITVHGSNERSVPAGTLVGYWEKIEMEIRKEMVFRCRKIIQNSAVTALEKAKQELETFGYGNKEESVICVFGSLYMASDALKILNNQVLI